MIRIAAMSNVVATGRRMKIREGLMASRRNAATKD
jgi:hypothetical protein